MRIMVIFFGIFLLFTSAIFAAEKKPKLLETGLFTYENDSVYGPDEQYSNGGQILLSTGRWKSSRENRFLSTIFGIKNKTSHYYTYGIGQKMYTPTDIDAREFLPNDRPYAGYLYVFLDKNIEHSSGIVDTLGLSLGVTGPASLAEKTQKNVHEMIGSPVPQGWDNQLENEPLLMLSWMRSIELRNPVPFRYDWNAIPKFYVNLGTPFTDAAIGFEMRFGWNLDNDLIPNRIRPTSQGIRRNTARRGYRDFSIYGFVEAEGGAMLYNTFLDGNISGSGRDTEISKNTLTYGFAAGVTARMGGIYVKWSNLYLSKEFKEQEDPQVIFSMTFGYLF